MRRGSLFHTKDGDMDFGWLILAASCVVGLLVFTLSSFGVIPGPSVAAWAWFGSFVTMAFMAGAAIGRARLIANTKRDPYQHDPFPNEERMYPGGE